MIGQSEEKLRPKSLWARRFIARYVVWIEVAGYALVITLFTVLIFATQIKAEDEFLHFIGDVQASAKVIQAEKNSLVVSLAPQGSRVGVADSVGEVEESPTIVSRASLAQDLRKQLDFARENNQPDVAEDISRMLAEIEVVDASLSERRTLRAGIGGQWYGTSDAGDVLRVGDAAGVVVSPQNFIIDINTAHPNVVQRGKNLKPDQPTTISLHLDSETVSIQAVISEGGRTEPKIRVLGIAPEDVDKFVAFLKDNPDSSLSFEDAPITVLIGEKSWASLIWK